MSIQFTFLQSEWPNAFDAATRVESAVNDDANTRPNANRGQW
jgi:hypothetical protein